MVCTRKRYLFSWKSTFHDWQGDFCVEKSSFRPEKRTIRAVKTTFQLKKVPFQCTYFLSGFGLLTGIRREGVCLFSRKVTFLAQNITVDFSLKSPLFGAKSGLFSARKEDFSAKKRYLFSVHIFYKDSAFRTGIRRDGVYANKLIFQPKSHILAFWDILK